MLKVGTNCFQNSIKQIQNHKSIPFKGNLTNKSVTNKTSVDCFTKSKISFTSKLIDLTSKETINTLTKEEFDQYRDKIIANLSSPEKSIREIAGELVKKHGSYDELEAVLDLFTKANSYKRIDELQKISSALIKKVGAELKEKITAMVKSTSK